MLVRSRPLAAPCLRGGVRRRALLLVVVAAAVAACGAGAEAQREDARASRGTLVVYADRNDLWLYDAATDRTRRVTTDGPESTESDPRFRSSRRVAYLAGGAVYDLDLVSGKRRLVRPRTVLAFAWSPDGETLAYLAQPRGVGRHALYLYRPDERRPRLVRRFPGPPAAARGDGSDRVPDDEIALAWSPAGKRIVLVDTDLAPKAATLYAFGADGRELARLRAATHAGWLDDAHVYFRALRGASWSVLSLRTGKRSKLHITMGRMHPALSPDGRFLALDSGRPWRPGTKRRGCACRLSIYDFGTGRERKLSAGLAAPLWLEARALAAMTVRACVGGECGVDVPMWMPRGQAARLDVSTGAQRQIGLRSTLDADVRRTRP